MNSLQKATCKLLKILLLQNMRTFDMSDRGQINKTASEPWWRRFKVGPLPTSDPQMGPHVLGPHESTPSCRTMYVALARIHAKSGHAIQENAIPGSSPDEPVQPAQRDPTEVMLGVPTHTGLKLPTFTCVLILECCLKTFYPAHECAYTCPCSDHVCALACMAWHAHACACDDFRASPAPLHIGVGGRTKST